VVERVIGNDEVLSSILSGGTSQKSAKNGLNLNGGFAVAGPHLAIKAGNP
jgi:hypothetical protein